MRAEGGELHGDICVTDEPERALDFGSKGARVVLVYLGWPEQAATSHIAFNLFLIYRLL